MTCEICNKKPSEFIRNGKRVCPSCVHRAANRQVFSSHTFHNGAETHKTTVVAETFNIDLEAILDSKTLNRQNLICPNCGTDYGTVDKTGKVGCSECYIAFKNQLMQILRKLDKRVRVTN